MPMTDQVHYLLFAMILTNVVVMVAFIFARDVHLPARYMAAITTFANTIAFILLW